jgi:hypothetical protein
MKRLIGVALVAMLAACGGGTGGKKPDGGKDGSGAGDHPVEAPGEGDAPADLGMDGAIDAGADAPAGDTGGAAGAGGAGADAGDAPAAEAGDAPTAEVSDAHHAAADVVTDAGPEAPAPRIVTVAFTGKVITVAGTPLGFDGTVRTQPVTGSFSYDANLGDSLPGEPLRGKYLGNGNGTTAFTFMVMGHSVKGSGKAILETENMSSDTFRFLDGPQIGDPLVRTMQFDGADAPMLTLFLAITDDTGAMLTSDALPDPFPMVNIANKDGGFDISHTFSLADAGGMLLMQLDTLVNQ